MLKQCALLLLFVSTASVSGCGSNVFNSGCQYNSIKSVCGALRVELEVNSLLPFDQRAEPVRGFVESHNGVIVSESELNGGSLSIKFSVRKEVELQEIKQKLTEIVGVDRVIYNQILKFD